MRSGIVCLLGLLISTPAFAHGGGLDGYGCHHNRKAGGYHCHRGVIAGQSFASKDEMLEAMRKQDKTPAPYGDSGKSSTKRN